MTNERILVVDDEKGVVHSCVRILEREGYVAQGSTNSTSVPDLLKQETFDLLLSDIKMPKIDGLALLKIAKEIDPHLTVVLITGYGTMEDAINAIRLGAQGFLMKPFEPEELVSTVKGNLARRAIMRDSLRLQTLLPLLEINKMLQISGGEISLVQRVLDIAHQAIGTSRLAWFNYQPEYKDKLVKIAVVPKNPPKSQLPAEAVKAVLSTAKPVWVLADNTLARSSAGHPNISGALLPLIIKGELSGLLIAETGGAGRTGPFDQISLDLLWVLTGQLAIVIENIQLFQQTEMLRAFNEDIIQNMTNGLIAIDQNHTITAFNPAASIMLGKHVQEMLNTPIDNIRAHSELLVNTFNHTLITGQAQAHREIAVSLPDGRSIPISVSTAPLAAKNGQQGTVGVVGVLEDLSEIKALEAEHRQLDRLAALGEMSAVVAHEIRNPVAGIAAGVEYLTRNATENSPEYEGGLLIRGEVERVNHILEDILFVARPLQLDLQNHDLSTILDIVIQRCQPQIQDSQVVIYTDYEDNLPLLPLDSQRLEQVFTNLVINATQAMLSGGNLWLKSNYSANKDFVVVTVTDDGPGIPDNEQRKIFEPFFTTKSKGTGLGLSVARRIIVTHGGVITMNSTQGQGTQFIIKLPVDRGFAP